MMKRTLISLCTLAILSACGSEMDFAHQEGAENDEALKNTTLPSCGNTIEMGPVYTNTSSALGDEDAGYCVTVYEASPSTNTCEAGSQEEHCAANANFRLKQLRNGCYALTYNKRSTMICPSCACGPNDSKSLQPNAAE